MNEKIMKQVSENEDTAIKLLNDVKKYKECLFKVKEYLINSDPIYWNKGHEYNFHFDKLVDMIDEVLESEE